MGTTAMTAVSTVYLALFTSDPTDAGTGTEVSGGGYARKVVTMAKNGTRAAHNTSEETWTASGANYGTITHWAIFDASTSGNMLYHGAFAASKVLDDGDTLTVKVNDIDVTVAAGAMSNYLADKMLEHTLGIAAYTAPESVYTALYTSNPSEDNSGTEVTGGNYARILTAFDASVAGAAGNTSEIVFTASGGSFGTVSYRGTMDASTSGNLLFYAALNASAPADDGDTVRFDAGDVSNSLD